MTPENPQLLRQIEEAKTYLEMYYHVVVEGVQIDSEPALVLEQLSDSNRRAVLVALSTLYTPRIPREGVPQRVNYDALKRSLQTDTVTIFTDDGMRALEIRAFLTALRTTHEDLNSAATTEIPASVLLTPTMDVQFSGEEIGRIIRIPRE